MSMLFRTHLRLARASVKQNRTRSFLTCLGIAIGIASIILILSLTGSISNLIKGEVKDIGSDLVVVRPSRSKDAVTSFVEELTMASTFEKSSLSLLDVSSISAVEGVTAVAPIAISTNTLMNDENTIPSATILGTTPDFNTIEPLALKYGVFLNEKNTDSAVVIGHDLALHLYNTSNPIGRTLSFYGRRFIVVGVLDEIEEAVNFDNVNFNNVLFMDINTMENLMDSVQIQQINVRVLNTSILEPVADNIYKTLKENRYGDTNFSVAYGDAITHPASNLLNVISGMLALVAGISLVVGGIGVMNIMLVSVSERTYEIGIRKAVGASAYNVLMQFMFEALILSTLGSILGIFLGYFLAFLVSTVTPFGPYISWEIIAITVVTTVGVGLIFGTYPALKAARKKPIDSLRHYQ
ncbi:MAG: ABC transporter permease [Candidatus Saccharibacteria bacterium]|nr:ABC transporter permease [Candidatus Saccharibacteria bacterium]